jgi:hypothetical protein
MHPPSSLAILRVDLKGLIAKLDPVCTRARYEVTCEHLAHELAGEARGDWSASLAAQGLDPARLRQALDRFLVEESTLPERFG